MSAHSGTASHLIFLAFHPEEIARQITLIESELFNSIKPWECIGQSWVKKDKETKAPNILGMIWR
jgi:son of sevenless-like protein